MSGKPSSAPQRFVAIGASAGGIGALKALLPNLPVARGFTYMLTLHMDPAHTSSLDRILSRFTSLTVVPATDTVKLQSDHLYVTPSDKDCTVLDGALHLEAISHRGPRHSVDVLFASLAKAHGASAVGIVLSGTGADGVQGVHVLKAANALVLVQDPSDAEFTGMPKAVLDAHRADVVASAAELGTELAEIVELGTKVGLSAAAPPSDTMRTLMQVLLRKTGFAFDQYKDSTLHRRIERRMVVNKLPALEAYIELVNRSDTEADSLLKDMQISVTGFFRDDDAFTAMGAVLESIIRRKPTGEPIRVWVAGCATGEEAFSIAMLLADTLGDRLATTDVQIFATDVDIGAITHARKSLYLKPLTAKVPERLRERYFEATEGTYQVRSIIRDLVVFAEHDLMVDPPFSRLDLVSCRNVLIYFKSSAQERLLKSFHYVLNPGGNLFLGSSEGVGVLGELFNTVDKSAKVFARKELDQPIPPLGDLKPKHRPQVQAAGRLEPNSPEQRARDAIYDRYAPPNVLVNKDFKVVRLNGALDAFMQLPQGDITVNVLDLIIAPLRLELRLLLQKAERERDLIRSRPIDVSSTLRVTLVVVPAASDQNLVIFEAVAPPDTAPANDGESTAASASASAFKVRELEQELIATRDHLKTNIEELAASNEALRSINEEFQTTTEELQSSNEELQTTNEELQSTNEELQTVNDELTAKTDELANANVDLEGILNAVTDGIVVLDADMRVTRYSTDSKRVFELLPTSIGRPLITVGDAVDLTLLSREIRTALQTHQMLERELELGEEVFTVRLIPNAITTDGGLIVSFRDETSRFAAERALRRLATVVRDSSDAITVLNAEGIIIEWNRGAEHLYGFNESEAIGINIVELFPEDQAPAVLNVIRKVIDGKPVEPFETVRRTKDGRDLDIWLTMTALIDDSRVPYAVAITENDLTEHKLADIARRNAIERAAKKLRQDEIEQVNQDTRDRFQSLSPREQEVMTLLVTAPATASSREIGDQLDISSRTVDTHRRRIREKMAARSLPDLVDKARLCGVLELPDP